MDLLRSRAVPALIACALALAASPAAADCSALDGTYLYKDASSNADAPNPLAGLVDPGAAKPLVKFEQPAAPKNLSDPGLRSRPRATQLSERVAVTYRAEGTKLRFIDAGGKVLTESGIASGGRWKCNGSRLERQTERMAGNADGIRTERVEQALTREGDMLVWKETVTTIDPPGGTPKRTESRHKLVAASA